MDRCVHNRAKATLQDLVLLLNVGYLFVPDTPLVNFTHYTRKASALDIGPC